MVGTLLLLPIYFVGANLAMLTEGFPVQDVPGELSAWYAWNWARTGLALLATVLCGLALRGPASEPGRPQPPLSRIFHRTKPA